MRVFAVVCALALAFIAVEAKNDNACTVCNLIVAALEDMNISLPMEDLENELYFFCDNLGSYSLECNATVKNYGVPLIETLKDGTPAKDACHAVGICKSSEPIVIIDDASSGEGPICEICELLVGVAEAFNATGIEGGAIDLMYDACIDLGDLLGNSAGALCNATVETYGVPMIEAIEQGENPMDVCSIDHLCESSFIDGGILECEGCKAVIYLLEDINLNQTEAAIINDLYKGCDLLGSELGSLCNATVNAYITPILEALEDGTPPDQVCDSIGLCSDLVQIIENLKAKAGQYTSTSSSSSYTSSSITAFECEGCELVVTLLEVINLNQTEKEIVDDLYEGCDLLGPTFGALCNATVNEYVTPILDAINDGTPPNQVCDSIGLCSSSSAALRAIIDQIKAKQAAEYTSTSSSSSYTSSSITAFECEGCELVVTLLEVINLNQTEKEIVDDLYEGCDLLGPTFGALCNATVNEYVTPILDAINDGTPPNQVCDSIGLCSSSSAALRAIIDQIKAKQAAEYTSTSSSSSYTSSSITAFECEGCELVVTLLEVINLNQTEKEIVDDLYEGCDLLGPTFGALCNATVNEYVTPILDAINDGTPPNQVCDSIGLCSSSSAALRAIIDQIKAKQAAEYTSTSSSSSYTSSSITAFECEGCELVVTLLEVINLNQTEKEIVDDLYEGCDLLGPTFGALCNATVNEYVTPILDAINDGTPPNQVCDSIGLCSSSSAALRAIIDQIKAKQAAEYTSTSSSSSYTSSSITAFECEGCELVVTLLEVINLNQTEKEIVDDLYEGCDLLGPTFGALCNATVNEYVTPILDAINDGTPPNQVCDSIGLCSSSSAALRAIIDQIKAKQAAEYTSTSSSSSYTSSSITAFECEGCELVVTLLEVINLNQTEKEIVDDLYEGCDLLGPTFGALCNATVNEYVTPILDAINDGTPPNQVCDSIGLCSSSSAALRAIIDQIKAKQAAEYTSTSSSSSYTSSSITAFECEGCELVVTLLEVINLNQTEQEIVDDLYEGCDLLGPTFGALCNATVNEYVTPILDAINDGTPPNQVCDSIGLCSSSSAALRAIIDQIKAKQAAEYTSTSSSSSYTSSSITAFECEGCELVVTLLEVINLNQTEKEIVDDLYEGCDLLGPTFGALCNATVNEYVTPILDAINDGTPPNQVCDSIGLCSSSSAALRAIIDQIKAKQAAEYTSTSSSSSYTSSSITAFECEGCELVVTLLEVINLNQTEKEIVDDLYEGCDLLGPTFGALCNATVNEYVTPILDAINDGTPPNQVCDSIGLCSSSSAALRAIIDQIKAKQAAEYTSTSSSSSYTSSSITAFECEGCELVVTLLEVINLNQTEKEIVDDLYEGCDLLGPTFGALCNATVNEYVTPILDAINDGTPPNQVCDSIGLCSSSSAALRAIIDQIKAKQAAEYTSTSSSSSYTSSSITAFECEGCELVVTLLEVINLNQTEKEIVDDLYEGCDLLGPTFGALCNATVNEYVTPILDAINDGTPPNQVCDSIGLCSSSSAALRAIIDQIKAKQAAEYTSTSSSSSYTSSSITAFECEGCELVVTLLEVINLNQTEKEIVDDLYEGCDLLGPTFGALCNATVNEYVTPILDAINDGTPPNQVCDSIGLCSSSSAALRAIIDQIKAKQAAEYTSTSSSSSYTSSSITAFECEGCELVVTLLEVINLNQTEQEIVDDLYEGCDLLGPTFGALCNATVNEYVTPILDAINDGTPPNQVCDSIGLCSSSSAALRAIIDQIKAKQAAEYTSTSSSSSYTSSSITAFECEGCELVVTLLEVINLNQTEKEIVDDLYEGCDLLGPTFGALCNATVNEYVTPILDAINDGTPPNQVCDSIGLCSSSSAALRAIIDQIKAKQAAEYTSTSSSSSYTSSSITAFECEGCELVVTLLEVINLNQTEKEIVDDLYEGCDLLGPTFGALCNATVNEYVTPILDAINDGTPPNQVCDSIGLCSSSSAALRAIIDQIKAKQAAEYTSTSSSSSYTSSSITAFECEGCELVVTLLEVINLNQTEQEIVDDLYEGCDLLGPTFGALCNATVNEYATPILDAINDGTPPNQVCDSIGLCSSSSAALRAIIDQIKAKQAAEYTSTSSSSSYTSSSITAFECEGCELVVTLLEVINLNQTEQEIVDDLYEGCDLLGPTFGALCNATVNEYVTPILDAINDGTPPNQVCDSIGLCSSSSAALRAIIDQIKAKQAAEYTSTSSSSSYTSSSITAFECEGCELVVTLLEVINLNQTEKEIVDDLYEGCDLLGPTFGALCNATVNEYVTPILDAINDGTPPNQVCDSIGLCSSSSAALRAIIDQIKAKQAAEYTSTSSSSYTSSSLTVFECEGCELVVTLLEVINLNQTEQEIIDDLYEGCDLLGPEFGALCNDTVNEYITPILDAIQDGTPPAQVCDNLGLCSSSNAEALRVVKALAAAMLIDTSNPFECEGCQLVITLLETVNLNQTDAEIEDALYAGCDLLGPELGGLCNATVNEYITPILEALDDGTPPDQVCAQLGLCGSSSSGVKIAVPVAIPIREEPGSILECEGCQLVVDILEDVNLNQTYEEILDDLYAGCDLLGSELGALCNETVNSYASPIIEGLQDGEPASQVCSDVGLCSSALVASYVQSTSSSSSSSSSSSGFDKYLCEGCEIVISIVEAIDPNKTEEEILDLLYEGCDLLGGTFGALCNATVNEYAGAIIKELQSGTNPDQICESIDLCGSSSSALAHPLSVAVVRSIIPLYAAVDGADSSSSVECEGCEFVVTLLESIDLNQTETVIQDLLYDACDLLGSDLGSLCNATVNAYLTPVLNAIEDGAPIQSACHMASLCPASPVVAIGIDGGSAECDGCEIVVILLESINLNQTEAEILDDLYAGCDLLGDTLGALCNDTVNEYVDPIIEALQDGTPSDEVCDSIGLCSNSSDMIKRKKARTVSKMAAMDLVARN